MVKDRSRLRHCQAEALTAVGASNCGHVRNEESEPARVSIVHYSYSLAIVDEGSSGAG